MTRAFVGAGVFDGERLHPGMAVLVEGSRPVIVPMGKLPRGCPRTALSGGTLMPGFVDLQVNGGGGVMLNDAPSVETLRTMAAAHRSLGTAAFLPTLITDTPSQTRAAIDAVAKAIAVKVPGIVGLHLEGPHLSATRKGAHDAALIRRMESSDLDTLVKAAGRLPNLMVTLAPESVTPDQIARLTRAGVIVSLGHSDCDYDTACAAIKAGAVCVTHLFNAMSQLGSRTPGLVGAALDQGVSCGLIADGIHVHPAAIRTALAAKHGPGKVFLVTDAMATAGSDTTAFTLGGREITRRDGRLTLADGTLAGADLTLARAIGIMVNDVGDSLEKALARTTSLPAALLRDPRGAGHWPDRLEDLIWLDDAFAQPVWCDSL